MEKRITEKIKLWGIVQGVGFRPFVAKMADRYNMKGEVLNIGGLVDVIVTDTKNRIDNFIEILQREKPEPAEIVHIKRMELPFREYEKFTILQSSDGDDEAAMIPADLSMCNFCQRELLDAQNERYMHPFISCMVCGPRYTIIDKIPYDRENTAMIDWPMCSFCEEEYTDIHHRRHHAQTISCHDCGPKLIFKTDKENIPKTDEPLNNNALCPEYGWKYNDCLTEEKKETIEKQVVEPLFGAAYLLKCGHIIAMKSMGGYNLIADPFNIQAVERLRNIKKRENKPFAVMFRDIDEIKKYCIVNKAEEDLLMSAAKPIILLEHKLISEINEVKNSTSKLFRYLETALNSNRMEKNRAKRNFEEISRSRFIGSFLPSMGAQYMLLDMFDGPLIVTSANLSNMPIIKDEEEMFGLMDKERDIAGVLYNERAIRVRTDDSVVRVIDGQPQMIRRSKGYVPVPLYMELKATCDTKIDLSTDSEADCDATATSEINKNIMVLATGGQLKNSFALSKGQFSYVSQYFGDLDTLENQQIYKENIERMSRIFKIKPGIVACDMHPLYFSTGFAEQYVSEKNNVSNEKLKIIKVQHHHAHVASVMAEHHLQGPVIGVSFDGTGYGTDGNIWGGEILICQGGGFYRFSHMKYIKMIGGDGSMKEAWKSAMCYAYDFCQEESKSFSGKDANNEDLRTDKLTEDNEEWIIDVREIIRYNREHCDIQGQPQWQLVKAALNNGINTVFNSSMGRLFDSVAALLGIKNYNDYEGQCAIMLEDAAARAMKATGISVKDDLALVFHERVAEVVLLQCKKARRYLIDINADSKSELINKVALTGGVFQNKILMEMTLKMLREQGFEVYYNVSVSPNDGGIALGQNFVALQNLITNCNI